MFIINVHRIFNSFRLSELTIPLMTTVTQFIYRLVNDGDLNYARLLRQRFSRKLDQRMGYHDGAAVPPLINRKPSATRCTIDN
jgi:hypothetical protein